MALKHFDDFQKVLNTHENVKNFPDSIYQVKLLLTRLIDLYSGLKWFEIVFSFKALIFKTKNILHSLINLL